MRTEKKVAYCIQCNRVEYATGSENDTHWKKAKFEKSKVGAKLFCPDCLRIFELKKILRFWS